MPQLFIGSEAVAAGVASHNSLRRQYRRMLPDVYVHRDAAVTPELRAQAAWLWSRRRGVLAGFSACALYGSEGVDLSQPVELIYQNRNHPPTLQVWGDQLHNDETQIVDGMTVTTPARTALDLACWYPILTAVPAIDLLARACELEMADVDLLVKRCRGRRGIKRARTSLDLVDAGSQSVKESWLRIILVMAGLPRPQTQIPISDEFGVVFALIDMGWEELKVGVEYDGEHHRVDRPSYEWDQRRRERIDRQGWLIVRVVAGQRPAEIISRVRSALASRA